MAELLAKAGDGDFLRSVAEAVLQLLMEADVEGLIDARRYERTGERLNWRNGTGTAPCTPARADAAPHPKAPAGLLLPALPRARGDDMADLQPAVADDDALDQQLQDRLLVAKLAR